MNFRQRSVIFLTFLISCLAIALLAGGLGTNYWVIASAVRESSNKSSGSINFGLFEGTKRLNHGFGERHLHMNILDILFHERSFMIKELYIATIGCISVAMFFGIISALLALVNTASNPTEYICHMPGLMLWNSFSAFASMVSLVTWIVQFFVKLQGNVLQREDVTNGGWTSRGRATIGHSFGLVAIAMGLFLLNVLIVHFIMRSRNRRSGPPSSKLQLMSDTKPNGNLMLY